MDCELRDITVYYESSGEGRPIIMLHGWSLDHHSIRDDIEPLFRHRAGWRRIYLDLPGHGRTPGKDWIRNQDDMLDVVLEFIDSVIPGQRFAVVGVSAGAYLARGVAYRKAEFLDGILLAAPLIVADDAKRRVPPHVALVAAPELLAELEPDDAEVFNQLAVVQSRKVVDALKTIAQAAGERGDEDFQARIRENPDNYAFSFDVDTMPSPCAAPTLIITGRQDSVVGYRDAWEILENYPRATFAVLDRSGHMLSVEQEELFQVLASEWLDRVAEYAENLHGSRA